MKSLTKIVFVILATCFMIGVNAQKADSTQKSTPSVTTRPTYVATTPVQTSKPKVISRIGLKTSLNFASAQFANDNLAENQLLNDGMKSVTRASAMFLWENGHSEYFVTQIGLGYTSKGYSTLNNTLTMHYIELPIIWNFRLPIAGPVNIMGGFGPYFSFAFSGKQKIAGMDGEVTLNDILEYTPGKSANENKMYNPFDGGLIFGGTVEINLPEGKILEVGAHYQVGVQKISNKWEQEYAGVGDASYENPGVKNRTFSISLSFLFDLNKSKK